MQSSFLKSSLSKAHIPAALTLSLVVLPPSKAMP